MGVQPAQLNRTPPPASVVGLMLCCCRPEILNTILDKGTWYSILYWALQIM